MKSTHSGRLERWVGAQRLDALSRSFKDWYGPPVHLLDVPGSVRICGDGDFVGGFERGYFASAADSLFDWQRRLARNRSSLNTGFTSISSALAQASQGLKYGWYFNKAGPTGVIAASSTLWRLGNQPSAGSVGAAAPGGTAHVDSDAGGFPFTNPSSGTTRLTGIDACASVLGNSLLLYDRLFAVGKTMASTGTEAVTGVPTRYQSTTAANEDYAGGNFGFIETGGTALANTGHNWTVCKYTNQAGTTGQTLPSVTGVAACIVDRLDQPISTWFVPLAAGDTGIAAWSQMQCSASVATGVISFCIGHPLGIISFPVVNIMFPFDWLTNRNQAPRIFDDACLAFLEVTKPTATASIYYGMIYATVAP